MNPYIEKKEEIASLKSQLNILDFNFRIEERALTSRIKYLQSLCTHKTEEDVYAWEYTGQDAGSGRSEYECSICGKTR